MKLKIMFLGMIFLHPLTGCSAIPATKTTLNVVDYETGLPMSNAVVRTAFLLEDHWDKPDKYEKIEKNADAHGQCVLEGNDLDHYFNVRINAPEYYESLIKIEAKKINRALNRWEPWNPTIEVKMRPIKYPVPMIHKRFEWKLKIPVFNMPIGFDLEMGDWMEPYGNGRVSDFVFSVTHLVPQEKGVHYVLAFSNPTDGIQEYQFPPDIHSDFLWPYEALAMGYVSRLDKYYVLDFPKVNGAPEYNLKKDVNYLIRVRSKVDKDGNIVSACYGKIKGEIDITKDGEFKFEYWFNPIPNERSLEYSGVNLLKN
jgi:hypothetical protein